SCPPAKIPFSRSQTPHGFATRNENMKNRILFGLILLLLATAALPVLAQPQPIQSPDAHLDRSVTFRFRAPNAKEVSLHLEGTKNTPMQKDGEGVWTVTTEPLEPDLRLFVLRRRRQPARSFQSRGHAQSPLRK